MQFFQLSAHKWWIVFPENKHIFAALKMNPSLTFRSHQNILLTVDICASKNENRRMDSSHIRSHEWEIGDFPSKWQFPNEYDEWIIDLVASWTLPFTYKRYFCICTGANATDFVCWNVFIVCYPKTYQIVCWTNIRIEFHFWMSSSKIQHLLLSWLIRNECKFTLDRIR